MKTYRWILRSPNGEKIKAYRTNEETGTVALDLRSQKIILGPSLDKTFLKQTPHLMALALFKWGKVVNLENDFQLVPSISGESVAPILTFNSDEEEQKKPLIGYLKKSAITHITVLLTLMLLVFFLKPTDNEVEPLKVTLVDIKKPTPITKKAVTKNKKIVKKSLPNKPINKNQVVKTQDKAPSKTPAILQGLKQSHNKQVQNQKHLKSFNQNTNSRSGGGTLGQSAGGTPSKIGKTGMRAAQSGTGAIGSKSSSGYGKLSGGLPGPSGLQIVSNQRGFSLPSGSDDNFAATGLDRDQIIAVVNRHRGEITYCYEQALKRNASLRGKISIQFVINPNGKVSKASIAESSANSATLETCMVARLRGWQFPKPVGAVNVDVLYPFHLTKLGQR